MLIYGNGFNNFKTFQQVSSSVRLFFVTAKEMEEGIS